MKPSLPALVGDHERLKRPHAGAWLALGLAASIVTGCHREPEADSVKATVPKPAAKSVQDYRLVGTVRAIKKDAGQVIIRHAAIAGFMDAMTMPFSLKNRELFDDLAVGDEVVGTLRVEKQGGEVKDYELIDLVVSRPATPPPAPSLSLSLAGGVPQIRPVPKRLKPGDPVPDFVMTDEDGSSVKLSDMRGKVVVLTFIYTRCPLPDFCPLMDRKFAALADAIGAFPERARQVRLVSLSFDPEHDTPEVLKKHALTQGARPPLWSFAVASHDELAKVAPALGLTYGPTATEIVHNLSTAVIDPEGNLAALLVNSEAKSWRPADLLKIITPLLNEVKTTP